MGIWDELRNSAAIEKEVYQQQIVKRLVILFMSRLADHPGTLL